MTTANLARRRARMTRLIKWAVACAAAAPLIYVAAAPWTFSEPALRQEIAQQVLRTTGLTLDTRARFTFALLPRPQIKIEEPQFSDPSRGVTLNADYLKGALRLLPLLAGRLEMASASLLRPDLKLDLDAADARVPARGARTGEKESATRLGVVSIADGAIRLVSRTRGLDLKVEAANFVLDWRTREAPFSLTGSAVVKGRETSLAFWIARPGDVLAGDRSPVTLRLKNEAFAITANGALTLEDRPQFNGRFSGSASNLRDALTFFETSAPLPGPFRNVSASGDAIISRQSSSLANLTLSVDGNAFEGAMALRVEPDGRKLVSGTLAASQLNLTPFTAEAPALSGPDGQWSREGLDLRDLSLLDVDLRVSATQVRLGRLQGEEAAFSILSRNGRLELGLGEVKAYRGVLKGRLSAQSGASGGAEGRASLSFLGVDASPLLWDLWGRSNLSGIATGSLILGGAGDTFAQIMRGLDGRGQIQINQGEIAGVDFEQALRRIDKRPLAGSLEMRGGRTSFDTLTANLRIARGVGAIEDGVMAGKGARIAFAGLAQIPDRTVKIEAAATQADAAGAPRMDAPQFQFSIAGPWDDATLTFDAQSLIRRSGAAQPLLPKAPAPPPAAPASE